MASSRFTRPMQLYAYTLQPVGTVNPVCAGCTQPPEDELLIAFTEHFKVILHPNQSSLGNVIIASRRHVARIADFNAAEQAEFIPLFTLIEPALEAAFGAVLVNLYYQRNWAYRTVNPDPPFKDGRPNPHVHCHIVPRYSRPVEFGGRRWVDATFGEPFVWDNVSLPAPLRLAIIERIRSKLPVRFLAPQHRD
jgi:diadenosine tetraphosphate (Ap4A) HIT family hydrolase